MHHVALHYCPVYYPFTAHDLHRMNSSFQKIAIKFVESHCSFVCLLFRSLLMCPILCSLTSYGLFKRLLICLRLVILALCPGMIASFPCAFNAKPSLCNIHMRFFASALCSVQPMYRHSAHDPFVCSSACHDFLESLKPEIHLAWSESLFFFLPICFNHPKWQPWPLLHPPLPFSLPLSPDLSFSFLAPS
jgi:hypothetical protein